jgi:hypothetical protein
MKGWRIPLVLATGLALAACGTTNPGGGGNPAVSSIEISPTTATIAPNGTQDFTAIAKDASGSTVSTAFTWQSSNQSVATIDANGKATAVGAGQTQITAKSGSIVSNTAVLTVAIPDTASSFLAAQGKKAIGADGATWYGGGDIKIVPVAGYSSVTFTATGLGSFTGGTATSSGVTIPKAGNTGTYANVQITATSAVNAQGQTVTPQGSGAVLSLKVDNQAPSVQWNSTQFAGDCTQDYSTSPWVGIPAPGTPVTWNYTSTDNGVGIDVVFHNVLADRELLNNVKPGGDYPFWVQEPRNPKNDPVQATASVSNVPLNFITLGGGKTHALQSVDALGNSTAVDAGLLPICNDYKEDRTSLNGNPIDGDTGHTMPTIAAATISGATTIAKGASLTVVASGVAGAPTSDPCGNCVTPPASTSQVHEVRYWRRSTSLGRWDTWEYVGRKTDEKGTNPGTVTFTSDAFSAGNSGTYQIAVSVVNEHGLQNIVIGPSYTVQ